MKEPKSKSKKQSVWNNSKSDEILDIKKVKDSQTVSSLIGYDERYNIDIRIIWRDIHD